MRCVWRQLKWDNLFKEVYWRLVVNGLPTAQRMHHANSQCLCECICPGQQHHFWDCPIAQAIVQVVVHELPPTWCSRIPGVCPIQQQHIWLMHPPPGPRHLHTKTWMVVCLSAINAMDCGRKTANDLCRQLHTHSVAAVIPPAPAGDAPRQRSITAFFHSAPGLPQVGDGTQQQRQQQAQHHPGRQPQRFHSGQPGVGLQQQPATAVPAAPPDGQRRITELFHPTALSEAAQQQRLQRQQNREQQRVVLEQQLATQQQQARQQLLVQAKQQAVAKFWHLLADFVILNPCPGPAFGTLPHDHPFLCIEADERLSLSPRQSS